MKFRQLLAGVWFFALLGCSGLSEETVTSSNASASSVRPCYILYLKQDYPKEVSTDPSAASVFNFDGALLSRSASEFLQLKALERLGLVGPGTQFPLRVVRQFPLSQAVCLAEAKEGASVRSLSVSEMQSIERVLKHALRAFTGPTAPIDISETDATIQESIRDFADHQGRIIPVLGGAYEEVRIIDDLRSTGIRSRTHAQAFLPNDPAIALQWALEAVEATKAWNEAVHRTSWNTTRVAVLDTGCENNHDAVSGQVQLHPELLNATTNFPIRTDLNRDVVTGSVGAVDRSGHGTHVTGIINAIANNGTGMAGATWGGVETVCIKITESLPVSSALAAAEGIRTARSLGAHIINASWGFWSPDPNLEAAVREFTEGGGVWIGSRGNGGDANSGVDRETKRYPACYGTECFNYKNSNPDSATWRGNILSVGAVTSANQSYPLANFSSWGGTTLVGPGDSIWSLDLSNSFRYDSGTSMATAYVTAAAAVLRAKLLALGRENELVDRLRAGSDDYCTRCGVGSVQWLDCRARYGSGLINYSRAWNLQGSPQTRTSLDPSVCPQTPTPTSTPTPTPEPTPTALPTATPTQTPTATPIQGPSVSAYVWIPVVAR